MKTKARFASRPLNGRSASLPPPDHPAILEGRTIYPARSCRRVTTGAEKRKQLAQDRWRGSKGQVARLPALHPEFGGTADVPDRVSALAVMLRQSHAMDATHGGRAGLGMEGRARSGAVVD